MKRNMAYCRRNQFVLMIAVTLLVMAIIGRLIYLMYWEADYYGTKAQEIRERERSIKAKRGLIYDRNGIVLASNEPVCNIMVIHNQVTDKEKVVKVLSKELSIDEEVIRKKVEKYSSIEKIKQNVPKEIADKIRDYELDGVMVDEDYKRYYPKGYLASKVIGFSGADNQGIIGLEIKYDKYLKGKNGKLLTITTANGLEIDGLPKGRIEPIKGYDLNTSLDVNIQQFAYQTAKKVKTMKQAKSVKVIIMNPVNGEIYAMVNEPEFDLNNPYTLTEEYSEGLDDNNLSEKLNLMWRNGCISDTYEPGSTFKIITAASAFEENVLNVNDTFSCPGYKIVEDRRIRCHKVSGHGIETFREGIMNSCNPVFMEIGARVGVERTYYYYKKLGLFNKSGIDLPGEAVSIMHKMNAIGNVELATMSFGQSFQITPLELLVAVSAVINGGTIVTPHVGVTITDEEKNVVKTCKYKTTNNAVSKKTCEIMKELLEAVVAEGTGKNAIVENQRVGGKTATSEKLPRKTGKYISSFLGFAPADNPEYIGIVLIDEPQGAYYGGTVAAPVFSEIFSNILNTNLIKDNN
ncbi:MAG: peptidoglycan glycosyltransferase [Lachnospiraceae bacterium]|nr:peptidoglycan glycosyltransferase [Lachnospiraceae bacterium]